MVPIPLKVAIDSVLGDVPLPDFVYKLFPVAEQSKMVILVLAVILLILIALFSGLQLMGSSLLRTYTGEKLVLDFRAKLFRHVQRLSLSYHDTKGTSDATYRIQYDTSAVQYIAIVGLIPFITASITLIAMLFIIFRIDEQIKRSHKHQQRKRLILPSASTRPCAKAPAIIPSCERGRC